MKRLFLTLALVLSVLSVMAADIVPISNAFKRGNVSSLSGSMDKEVDMALPGSSKKCNANDAVSMLNAFFGGNKPTGSQSFTMLIKKRLVSLSVNYLLHPVNIA